VQTSIPLPKNLEVKEQDDFIAEVIITPFYPGFGMTVGNALRRVLFSSLPGAAVSTVKIKDVNHEFSSVPNVKEDVVELIMNFKLLRLKLQGDEPQKMTLKVKGEKTVTAKDIKGPTQVEIVNKDLHIATLTDASAKLEIELTVTSGRGYVPIENREKEEREIGTIAIDALYSPVKTVTFRTENVRVEKMTNWDKLTLRIETDGTTTPREAVMSSMTILEEQFNSLCSLIRGEKTEEASTDDTEENADTDGNGDQEPETTPAEKDDEQA